METPNSPEILTMALNMHDEYNPTTFPLRDYKTSNKVTTMMFPGAAPEQSYSSGYSHESNNYLTNMLNPQELEQVEKHYEAQLDLEHISAVEENKYAKKKTRSLENRTETVESEMMKINSVALLPSFLVPNSSTASLLPVEIEDCPYYIQIDVNAMELQDNTVLVCIISEGSDEPNKYMFTQVNDDTQIPYMMVHFVNNSGPFPTLGIHCMKVIEMKSQDISNIFSENTRNSSTVPEKIDETQLHSMHFSESQKYTDLKKQFKVLEKKEDVVKSEMVKIPTAFSSSDDALLPPDLAANYPRKRENVFFNEQQDEKEDKGPIATTTAPAKKSKASPSGQAMKVVLTQDFPIASSSNKPKRGRGAPPAKIRTANAINCNRHRNKKKDENKAMKQEIVELTKKNNEKDAKLAEKDAKLAEKDAKLAEWEKKYSKLKKEKIYEKECLKRKIAKLEDEVTDFKNIREEDQAEIYDFHKVTSD